MAKLTVEEKMRISRLRLVADYGFFASLLFEFVFREITGESELQEKEHGLINTMATNGREIMWYRKFVERLPVSEVCFVMCHEVMHVALGHLWRREGRNHKLWNYATDFAINAIVKASAEAIYEANKNALARSSSAMQLLYQIKMPKHVLYLKKFEGLSAEEIYEELKKKSKDLGEDGISYGGKIYRMPTNHGGWKEADSSSSSKKQHAKSKWDGKLLQAAEQLKNQGLMPAGLERALAKITHPQKDWRTLLQECIEEVPFDYSLNPPDRRFHDFPFYIHALSDTIAVVKNVMFFVDTSGSMTDEEINMCYSEIQGAISRFQKHLHGNLFFFDAEVCKEHYDFDDVNGDISKLKPYGGGGTSFPAVFQWINSHRSEYPEISIVIILTDGGSDYPPPYVAKDYKVLWVYTTKGNKPPFGRHTTLEMPHQPGEWG